LSATEQFVEIVSAIDQSLENRDLTPADRLTGLVRAQDDKGIEGIV
jgi:hypothetical protein